MWYENKDEIDYNKPIIAKDNEDLYLLMPQVEKGNYAVVGYNWFNLNTGDYNSCSFFATAREAVEAYGSYEIYNAELEVERY